MPSTLKILTAVALLSCCTGGDVPPVPDGVEYTIIGSYAGGDVWAALAWDDDYDATGVDHFDVIHPKAGGNYGHVAALDPRDLNEGRPFGVHFRIETEGAPVYPTCVRIAAAWEVDDPDATQAVLREVHSFSEVACVD